MPYRRVRERGILFLFKYDDDAPDLLHIYVRHLTTIDDALDTFFDPNAESQWNPERARWETQSATHVLYWFWLEDNRKVMVVSCFQI